MAQGISLHIGLNGVDASKYNGWPGTLAGCVNDANSMQAIAVAQGFTPSQLITQAATADAILTAIGQAAHALQTGDTFLISYSGHGGQVPDPTGDSANGLDDTWVAYDRMILGHELYNLWGQFAPGVYIEVYSDSCHSGTVIRDYVISGNNPYAGVKANGKRDVPALRGLTAAKNFATVFAGAPNAAATRAKPKGAPPIPPRSIPPELALQLYTQNRTMYESLQWSRKRDDPQATVILISGCQDNQTSQDGTTNGLFTEKLLAVWNNGAFQGTLPQFHQAIVALMPSDQTPNYFSVGPSNDTFTNCEPLTVVGGTVCAPSPITTGTTTSTTTGTTTPTTTTVSGNTGGSTPPSVSGPAGSVDPNGDPPQFTVTLGSNQYYVFEITSDPSLFGNDASRTDSTWYASWADPDAPARMIDSNYTLPQTAWQKINGNGTLYYRVGSTSSSDPNSWNNYLVSVSDGDAPTQAPSFTLGAGAGRGIPASATSRDMPFGNWVSTS